MTLSSQGVKLFFPRSPFHIKLRVRPYSGTKYSNCPLSKRIDRNSDLNNFSRRFSQESFLNYPTKLFNKVADSDVCAFTKDFFVCIHDLTGLPWWCTIAASAAILKLYSFPWTVYQIRLTNRLQEVNKEMPKILEKAYLEVRANQKKFMWTAQKAKKMHKLAVMSKRKKLIQENNCHPLKIILASYFELPVWIVMSMTWRTMAYGFSDDISSSKVLLSQMAEGGPFWCVNLTLPDPTYALSVLIVLSYFSVVQLSQIQAKILKRDSGKLQKIIRNLSRCFGVLAAVVCAFMPSSVAVFWSFSIVLTLIRDLILVSPKVRRVLRLPYQNFSYKEIFEMLKNTCLKKVK